MKKSWYMVVGMLFNAWLIGNVCWCLIVSGISVATGRPWLEVEHYVRFTSIYPSLKDLVENSKRNNPDFNKNF